MCRSYVLSNWLHAIHASMPCIVSKTTLRFVNCVSKWQIIFSPVLFINHVFPYQFTIVCYMQHSCFFLSRLHRSRCLIAELKMNMRIKLESIETKMVGAAVEKKTATDNALCRMMEILIWLRIFSLSACLFLSFGSVASLCVESASSATIQRPPSMNGFNFWLCFSSGAKLQMDFGLFFFPSFKTFVARLRPGIFCMCV